MLATFYVNDVTMLPVMLAEIRRRGYDFLGSVFDADPGMTDYNSCSGWALPNIKQRKDAVSRGKPSRKKAAGLTRTSTRQEP